MRRTVAYECGLDMCRTGLILGMWVVIVVPLLVLGGTGCDEWTEGGSVVEVESPFTPIGSPFPTTVLIPNRKELWGRAFVQTASPPLGVFSFDLDALVPPLPFEFYNMSDVVQGIPDGLAIDEDKGLAFVTTSGEAEGVWLFDPLEKFRFLTSFTYTGSLFALPFPLPDSEGRVADSIRPTFTAGAALMKGKLYIPTSNYTQAGSEPVCAPGTVKVVGLDDATDPPSILFLPPPDVIVTSDFNPVEVTPLDKRILLVTNTGVLAIRDANGVPLSEGSVDVIDTELDCIVANYPLGLGAPSFTRVAIAVQEDQFGRMIRRGYLGSAAFNHVYELDLTGVDSFLGTCADREDVPKLYGKVLAGPNNPIRVTNEPPNSPNFIVQVAVSQDGTRAYATGFNSGTLAILELETKTDEEGTPLPSKKSPLRVIQVTDALPTQNESGPGPVAVRPGVPGVDFQGPDVFVVTGTPVGELRGIQTY